MAGVVAGVEADVVGAEHAAQHLGPRRQQPVDLRRRERDVEEEADREIGPPAAQRLGHEREMEVVDPDPGPRRAHAAIVSAKRSFTST